LTCSEVQGVLKKTKKKKKNKKKEAMEGRNCEKKVLSLE